MRAWSIYMTPCCQRVRSSRKRKKGAPSSDGDDPDRQLSRRDDRAGEQIGQDQERGSGQCARRQQHAMIGPRDQPDQVRHDQADEADQPAKATAAPVVSATTTISRKRVRSTSTPRCRASRSPSTSRLSRAALRGRTIRAERDQRQDRQVVPPGRAAEAAHRPEDDRAQLLVVGHVVEHAHARADHRVDRDADQDQRDRVDPAVATGEGPDHECGDDPAGKRCNRRRHQPERRRADHDRRDRANAAPLETPMMLGSASGLRKMPCSTAPEIASAAPTIVASSTAESGSPRPPHPAAA